MVRAKPEAGCSTAGETNGRARCPRRCWCDATGIGRSCVGAFPLQELRQREGFLNPLEGRGT